MQRGLALPTKLTIIALIISVTLLYSLYWHNKFSPMINQFDGDLILKTLPEFQVEEIQSKQLMSKKDFINNEGRLTFIHFWGTWCGPCEAELPPLLDMAKKFKNSDVQFVLIAVQDTAEKVTKYMKRFGTLPENIVLALDVNGDSMTKFGTVKVPESCVFNHQGTNLSKFIGPQSWEQTRYYDRLVFYHNSSKPLLNQKIETH